MTDAALFIMGFTLVNIAILMVNIKLTTETWKVRELTRKGSRLGPGSGE